MKLKELKRKVIAAFAVMMFAFIATVGTTYAYWVDFIATPDVVENEQITIGEAKEGSATISVNLTQDTTETLVPSGRVADSVGTNPVEQIVLNYDVTWNTAAGNPSGTEGTLTTAVENISGDTNDLINFNVSADQIIVVDGNAVTVTINITMDEPANEAEYNAIINAVITFDVTFTVTPN